LAEEVRQAELHLHDVVVDELVVVHFINVDVLEEAFEHLKAGMRPVAAMQLNVDFVGVLLLELAVVQYCVALRLLVHQLSVLRQQGEFRFVVPHQLL